MLPPILRSAVVHDRTAFRELLDIIDGKELEYNYVGYIFDGLVTLLQSVPDCRPKR